MALELSGLLVVNVAYLVVGAAALAAVGWVNADTSSWYRLGVAYPLGLVVVTIPASYLALLRVRCRSPPWWSAPPSSPSPSGGPGDGA